MNFCGSGVYTVAIDAEQGKVTVTGIVDPNRLIKKLEKSGKHAELWVPSKNFLSQSNIGFNNPMFKNNPFENGKFGKLENKAQKNGGIKGGHQQQQQLMKGLKDMKMVPNKEQKTVRFNIPAEDEVDASGDDFDDEYDDDDEGSGDEFADEFGRGHNQKFTKPSMIGGGQYGQKGYNEKDKDKKKGSSGAKKSSFFDMIKGFGMKGDRKHGNGGRMNGGGGNGKSNGGGKKDGGKNSGFHGDFGKNVDFGEVVVAKNKGGNGGGAVNNNNNGAKKGGGKNSDGSQANNKVQASFKGMNNLHGTNHHRAAVGLEGGEGSFMSQMGSMGPMANYPMGQVGSMPAAQGLPAMNGGYYQNPYQQQYMAMMMNQHQQHPGLSSGMYQPMMYARPPQPVGYVPPMPHPASDPYVHMFSDENTGSCSVM